MSKFFSEFRDFISKGNVMDMAVGVIVGGAITSIVKALTDNILTPILGVIMGGLDFSSLSFGLGNAQIQYGAFIQAVINFLIVAFVLFCIVKSINTMREKAEAKLIKNKKEEVPEEAPVDPQLELLGQIRDLLEKQNADSTIIEVNDDIMK